MIYEYDGCLRSVLDTPELEARDEAPCVLFTADDISSWGLSDLPSESEWRLGPAISKRTERGVRIEGRFSDVHQIDNLAASDPSFWVPLSTLDGDDDRFPVDASKFAVAELTYRCLTPNARPAWMWTYPGGMQFDWLAPTQEWRTIARRVQHYGFPTQIDAVIIRLYATSRTVEALEVESVRFREMTPAEASACEAHLAQLERVSPTAHYPLLDTYLPFGSYMDAGASKRLAAMLGISFEEYWGLVLEDVARHHHNTIALESVERLTAHEWQSLLEQAQTFDIKFYAIHDLPLDAPEDHAAHFVQTHVKPYADSPAILAWSLYDEPPERAFTKVMQAQALVREADPNHPYAVMMRTSDAFPLFAKHVPVCGIAHYGSHNPRYVSDMLEAHVPLGGTQDFWFLAPAFTYATDTPAWHTGPEMRLMMNLAFANGARGWHTFAYHNDPIWIRGSCQRSLTGPFLTFSDLWSELGQRVEYYSALAPLFLQARPAPLTENWFAVDSVAHARSQLPEGVPPTGLYRLCGPDFELYCVVSHDTREMTTAHVDVAGAAAKGLVVYDLADYVRGRKWVPISPKRHLEMFPGQQHIFLVAKPKAAALWRESLTERLIRGDRRQLAFDLPLARAYGLDTAEIEKQINRGEDTGVTTLENTSRARDALLDLIYGAPELCQSRSKLIEVSAAICGCDGSLCRLLGKGEADRARQLGFQVIPLARELAHLRLELRQGRGAAIRPQCQDLAKRTLETLAEIRAAS